MTKHFCLFAFALIFLNCSHLGGQREIASLDSTYLNIDTKGASNTTGCGASVPLLARLRDHLDLNVTDHDLQRKLSQPRTLIAGDYFFPTNYTFLTQQNGAHSARVKNLLDQWSRDYDLILVGLLPLWEDLSENEKTVAQNFDAGGYKNILDILENYKTAVRAVNTSLRDYAQAHPQKVKLLSLKNMITASWDFYNNTMGDYAYPIPPNPFNADHLHFTDYGQAFFLNAVVFPVLNPQIPPIIETGRRMSDYYSHRALSRILDSRENYLNGTDGGFWSTIVESRQFIMSNASFENREAQDMQSLLDVAKVIEGVAKQRKGFPLYVQFNTEPQKVSLDLSSALFYTRIDLNKLADNTFEGWGYDYWMLAGLLNPPKTNYRFVFKKTNVPGTFDLEWTLYPIVSGQLEWLKQNYGTEKIRLSTLDSRFVDQIKRRRGHSIKYKLQVQIENLN